jgi:hypothetical protein
LAVPGAGLRHRAGITIALNVRKTDLRLSRVCDLGSEMSLDFEGLWRIDWGLVGKARGK